MNMHVVNSTLAAPPLPVDDRMPAQPAPLPPELLQQLDSAVRLAMLSLPITSGQGAPTGMPPPYAFASFTLPQPWPVAPVPPPNFAPQIQPQQPPVAPQPALECWQPTLHGANPPPPVFMPQEPGRTSRLDAMAVLQRNEGLFEKPKSEKDLQQLIAAPNTSPEVRRALQTILADHELTIRLDSAKQGRTDGKIGLGDIHVLSNSPELVEHNRAKAASFTRNYISSDTGAGGESARGITANDAMRELYKFSDYLPKRISREDLQAVVDGTGGQRKRPPQLVAAAQYMLDNPQAWNGLTGGESNSISRSALCDAVSGQIRLRPSEHRVLDTIERNAGDFFDGRTFDRDKLQAIVKEPNSKPENVDAAKQLLDNPVLFGLLDNARRGHRSNAWRSSDDGRIGRSDLQALREKVDPTPAPEPPTRPAAAGALTDPSAVDEMRNGQLNQPDIKKEKGGGFRKFLTGFMKAFSVFEEIAAAALGAVAALKIPIVSQAAAAGSMVATAVAGGLNVARTAINGGSVKEAFGEAVRDFGINAASVAIAPGAGQAIAKVTTKEVVKEAVKGAAEEASMQAAEALASRKNRGGSDRRS